MSRQDIEDRLPALLRAAADAQPDAPGLFDGVTTRVQRRQHRRRGLAVGAVAAVVAAAVAVPVAVSSHRTDQRVVTVPAAPTAPPSASARRTPVAAASCPGGGGSTRGSRAKPPSDRLLPDHPAALTVCAWQAVGVLGVDRYRLAWSGQVSTAQVVVDVGALNRLPAQEAFLGCLRARPLLLSVLARYADGRTVTVQLVEPCDAYFTNGSFAAELSLSVVRALEEAQPVPPGPNGYLSVRLAVPPTLRPVADGRYQDGVRVLLDGRQVAVLTRQPDDTYRGRVPAGTYTLAAETSVGQPCAGRTTVADGLETTAVATCAE